jgi:hypothetical protein
MTTYIFAATDLVAGTRGRARNGNPPWLDVIFSGRSSPRAGISPAALGGAGLYAIFFDALLVYIGVFVGPASNPQGGSVLRTRWIPHIGTMTMRGQRVSLRANARPMLDHIEGEPLAALTAAFANPAAALHTSQGMEMAARKVRFATGKWADFSGPIDKTLERIQFGYVRLELKEDGRIAHKTALSGRLSAAEKTLVGRFKPPLNTAHNPCPQPATAAVEEVMTAMEEEIAKALAATTVTIPAAEEMDPANSVLDELSADAVTFVDELAAAAGRTSDVILYFTHDGNEVRLGPDTGARRHARPYLILKERNGTTFGARSTLPVEEARAIGFEAGPTSDEAMESAFPVMPDMGVTDRLLELCKRAAARRA